MKACLYLKPVLTGLFFLLIKTSLSQPVTPVFFNSLRLPLHDLQYLHEAGLVLTSSDREIQLWDAKSQAYYGGIIISSPENGFMRIRKLEYLKEAQLLAIIGEQVSYDSNRTPVYKDYLFVYDIATLTEVCHPAVNGMAELIKYKYGRNHDFPELKNAASIFQYCLEQRTGNLCTIDRKGDINIYKGGHFIKTIRTHAQNSQILRFNNGATHAFVTDDSTLTFKRINLTDESELTIYKLVSIPSCRNEDANNESYKNFSVRPAPDGITYCILDSLSRVRIYNSLLNISNKWDVPMNNHRLEAIDLYIPAFTGYFIFETGPESCMRIAATLDMKNQLINTFSFNDIGTARLGTTFSEENGTKLRIMIPGFGEHETDFSKLEEKELTDSNRIRDNFYQSAGWEHGYVNVNYAGNDQFSLDVFQSDGADSKLLYTSTITLRRGESLYGIRAGAKWYITTSKPDKDHDPLTTLHFYDSSGRNIRSLKVSSPLQMLEYPFGNQQIFSNDEQHLMIKEFLGNKGNKDSCRIRVYKTSGFKPEADILFTEISGETFYKRNAFFGKDSKTFHFAALSKKGTVTRTVLNTYTLTPGKAVKTNETPLCADAACRLPISIQTIELSSGDSSITFSGLVNTSTSPEQPVFTQAVRRINTVNNRIDWFMDLGSSVVIRKILYFKGFVGLQTDDNIYFYKPGDGGPEYFMSLQTIVNLKYRTFSNLYASNTSADPIPVYYDKSGNELLVSFQAGTRHFNRAYFDLDFNRPDSIISRIPGGDSAARNRFQNAIYRRSTRPGNLAKEFNIRDIPEVTLIRTDYVDDVFKMKLSLKSRRPISYLRIVVNGNEERKDIMQDQGLASARILADSLIYELLLPLHHGENKISLSAIDTQQKESIPLNLTQFEMKAPSRINLHVLILSVGEYNEKRQNVDWINRDGRKMAALFSQNLKDTVYGTIHVDTFFNHSVNAANIKKWFDGLASVSPRDYIIVFYNGHGKIDAKGQLLLMTSETQFQEPFTNAIGYQTILGKLDSLPARQKLFMIDACNSGDYFEDDLHPKIGVESNFDFLQRMFTFSQKGNGTFVFTSCAGNMPAVGPDGKTLLTSGPFVTAIEEALQKNMASTDSSGSIFINDFINYVTRRTRVLSRKLEIPNLKINNPSANWRIR